MPIEVRHAPPASPYLIAAEQAARAAALRQLIGRGGGGGGGDSGGGGGGRMPHIPSGGGGFTEMPGDADYRRFELQSLRDAAQDESQTRRDDRLNEYQVAQQARQQEFTNQRDINLDQFQQQAAEQNWRERREQHQLQTGEPLSTAEQRQMDNLNRDWSNTQWAQESGDITDEEANTQFGQIASSLQPLERRFAAARARERRENGQAMRAHSEGLRVPVVNPQGETELMQIGPNGLLEAIPFGGGNARGGAGRGAGGGPPINRPINDVALAGEARAELRDTDEWNNAAGPERERMVSEHVSRARARIRQENQEAALDWFEANTPPNSERRHYLNEVNEMIRMFDTNANVRNQGRHPDARPWLEGRDMARELRQAVIMHDDVRVRRIMGQLMSLPPGVRPERPGFPGDANMPGGLNPGAQPVPMDPQQPMQPAPMTPQNPAVQGLATPYGQATTLGRAGLAAALGPVGLAGGAIETMQQSPEERANAAANARALGRDALITGMGPIGLAGAGMEEFDRRQSAGPRPGQGAPDVLRQRLEALADAYNDLPALRRLGQRTPQGDAYSVLLRAIQEGRPLTRAEAQRYRELTRDLPNRDSIDLPDSAISER